MSSYQKTTKRRSSIKRMNTSLLFTGLLAFVMMSSSIAYNTKNISGVETLLRRRALTAASSETVPCSSITAGVCECPGTCMVADKNATVCDLKKCYGWDTNLGKCYEVGPKFVPAIVLQAIPFTGAFGSGFGNMQRWDIFGIYMAIVFGPVALLLVGCCFAMFGCCSQNEDGVDLCKCLYSCLGCVWGIGIVAMWIWGIVTIANKSVLGPNGCPLV